MCVWVGGIKRDPGQGWGCPAGTTEAQLGIWELRFGFPVSFYPSLGDKEFCAGLPWWHSA